MKKLSLAVLLLAPFASFADFGFTFVRITEKQEIPLQTVCDVMSECLNEAPSFLTSLAEQTYETAYPRTFAYNRVCSFYNDPIRGPYIPLDLGWVGSTEKEGDPSSPTFNDNLVVIQDTSGSYDSWRLDVTTSSYSHPSMHFLSTIPFPTVGAEKITETYDRLGRKSFVASGLAFWLPDHFETNKDLHFINKDTQHDTSVVADSKPYTDCVIRRLK